MSAAEQSAEIGGCGCTCHEDPDALCAEHPKCCSAAWTDQRYPQMPDLPRRQTPPMASERYL